jgi:hypothetical protein
MSQQASQHTDGGERHVEVETGPLLPRWLSILLYAIFIPWCLFATVWIGHSMVVQHKMMNAVKTVGGPWEGEAPAIDSPQMRLAVDTLCQRPRDSLLYILQYLQQDELRDRRMAEAITLRKAVAWEVEARRRALFAEVLPSMNEKTGELDEDYRMSPESMRTLLDLIHERTAEASTSYTEQKTSEVLEWLAARMLFEEAMSKLDEETSGTPDDRHLSAEQIEKLVEEVAGGSAARQDIPQKVRDKLLEWLAQGRPQRATGPERRRIKSLEVKYKKKVFFGKERSVLKKLAEQWRADHDAIKQGLSGKFALMLDGKTASLTDQERAFCEERASYWENQYNEGRVRLCRVVESCVDLIVQNDISLDHPHIWDIVNLLQEGYEPARASLARTAYALRNRRFTLIYLSQFVLKDHANPVMAVETPRLTKEEHEQLLERENHRRRLECIKLLREIGKAYYAEPFKIKHLPEADQDEFVRLKVVRTLEDVLQDRAVGKVAQEALDDIKESCPRWFH